MVAIKANVSHFIFFQASVLSKEKEMATHSNILA